MRKKKEGVQSVQPIPKNRKPQGRMKYCYEGQCIGYETTKAIFIEEEFVTGDKKIDNLVEIIEAKEKKEVCRYFMA